MTDATLPTAAPTPAKDVDALLAYIGPLFIWTMMKHGDNPSYVWHAKNSAGIFAVDVALTIVLQVLWVVMPVSLFTIFGHVALVIRIGMGVMSIYALWQTWNGKQAMLPFVTGLGQKIPLEKWFHKKDAAPVVAAPVATTPAPAAAPAPVAMPEPMPVPAPEAPKPVEMPVSAPAPMPEPMPTPIAVAPEATPMPAPAAPAPVAMPEPMPAPAAAPMPEAPKPAEPTPPQTPAV